MNKWDILKMVLAYDQEIAKSMSLEMPVSDVMQIILDLMDDIDKTKGKDLVDRPESYRGRGTKES